MTLARNPRLLGFAAFAAMGVAVEWGVTRSVMFRQSGVVPLAVLFDLVVMLPVLYAAVVLLPARRPLLDVTPALTLGAIVAGVLLAGRPETKLPLRIVGAATEAVILVLLTRRLQRSVVQLKSADEDDWLVRVEALTDPIMRFAGAELAVFYYALLGQRVRRPSRPNELGYVDNSGLGGLLLAVGIVGAMEGLTMHLLLRSWSPRVALLHTALSVYGLVWLMAVYQAARLRPVILSHDRLLIRTSLLWTIDVPRNTIASAVHVSEMPRGTHADPVLRAALGVPPVLLLTLAASAVARGPFGLRRSVRRIALYVDEPVRLTSWLDDPEHKPSRGGHREVRKK